MKKTIVKIICYMLALILTLSATPLVFGEDEYKEDLTFNGSLFENDSAIYNHDLCRYASRIIVSSNRNIVKTLVNLKFDTGAFVNENYYAYDSDRDEENFFIVHYDITVAGKQYRTLVVCLSGSNSEQWNSNFDPYGVGRKKSYAGDSEKGVIHIGFADARDYVYAYLKDYVSQYCMDSDLKILITGHSRGAAAANLLSAKLIKEKNISGKAIDEKNIYTYTFATPNNTCASDLGDSKYERIFNIVNPEDLITKLIPAGWGFGKYGTTYSFVSKSNCEPAAYFNDYLAAMKSYYANYSDDNYLCFSDGEQPTDTLMESIVNEVSSLDEFYNKTLLEGTDCETTLYEFFQNYFCPFVNGSVSDDDDAAFALIVGLSNMLSSSDESSFINIFINFMAKYQLFKGYFSCAHDAATYYAFTMSLPESVLTRENASVIFKLYNIDTLEVSETTTGILCSQVNNRTINSKVSSKLYSVITAVDDKSITLRIPTNGKYTVTIYPYERSNVDCVVDKFVSGNGKIYRNTFFDLSVSNDDSGKFYTEYGNTVFSYNNTQSTVGPTYFYQFNQLPEISLNCTVDAMGTVDGKTSGLLGDLFTISAKAKENNSFFGWYKNGILITENEEYSSLFKANSDLTAKFSDNYFCFKDNCTLEGNVVCGLPEGIESIDDYIVISGYEIRYDDPSCLGTGSRFDVSLGSEVIESYYIAIQGDLNGDGYVDAFDVSVMTSYVNFEETIEEGTAQFFAAEISKDGFIDNYDLVQLIARANFS